MLDDHRSIFCAAGRHCMDGLEDHADSQPAQRRGFVTGLCAVFTVPGPGVPERVLGMFVVSVPMLLAALLVPGGFGGGDIKLMAAGGLFLGWEGNVLAAALGIFAGGIWGLYLLLFKRADRRDVFPFGPCLCGGMLAAFVILCTRGSYHIL